MALHRRVQGQAAPDGISEHQVGGCRFGNDPKTSVLDRHCQTHDVDNVFVVDRGFMPTIGGFNPSLTIQANAFRVSDYIIKQWKGRRVSHPRLGKGMQFRPGSEPARKVPQARSDACRIGFPSGNTM